MEAFEKFPFNHSEVPYTDNIESILEQGNEETISRLAEILRNSDDKIVKKAFKILGNLQRRDKKENKKKIELSDEIIEKNSLIPNEGEELLLGEQDFEKDKIRIIRSYRKEMGCKHLDYIVKLENGKKIGDFSWSWGEDEDPMNYHREIFFKYQGFKLGEALLLLSEDTLNKLGEEISAFNAIQKSTICLLLKNGYVPKNKKDITPELLQLEESPFHEDMLKRRIALMKKLKEEK